MSRPELAAVLDLAPHPEGGWYRRTWTSPHTVPTPRGPRPTATAILYLLDGPGRWHRVASTELWLWHSGSAAELVLGGDGDAPGPGRRLRLGPAGPETDTVVADADADDAVVLPQREVPAGVWQRAYPLGAEPVLVSCVVSPGFDFADFELR